MPAPLRCRRRPAHDADAVDHRRVRIRADGVRDKNVRVVS